MAETRSLRQRSRVSVTSEQPNTLRLSEEKNSKTGSYSFLGERLYLILVGFYFMLFTLCLYADQRLPEPRTVSDKSNADVLFVEQRARNHLVSLTSMGPRIVGSYENEVLVVDALLRDLNYIKQRTKPQWNLEIDVQKPTGSFNLMFQDGFTSYYSRVKNVLVKLGPRQGSNNSVLINCHYDTAPGSPGASDDAVSCAIMLEVLNVLSQSNLVFKHSIIFNFNGAEENILQAAHGFITQHPWAKNISVFVNLEACGSGGREIVFQAGPENPWLVRAYAEYVPHPFASVLGQEIFSSGVIPGDTDYRIYRDYGHIPGLDIAYIRNGYVYHTKYDTQQQIPPGTIQRAGENVLALLRHLAVSPFVSNPGEQRYGNVVFFDVLGFYMVLYSEQFGIFLNLICALMGIIAFYISAKSSKSSGLSTSVYLLNVGAAVIVILISWLSSLGAVALVSFVVDLLGTNMSWYYYSIWAFCLYSIPTIMILVITQRSLAQVQRKVLFPLSTIDSVWLIEELYFQANRIIWIAFLLTLTLCGCRSVFLISIFIFFPVLIRSCGIYLFPTIKLSRRKFIVTYMIAQLIPTLVALYAMLIVHYIFLPIMGRAGSNINPDLIVGVLMCFCTIFVTNCLISIIHVIHSMYQFITALLVIFGLSFIMITFTPLGFPYSSEPSSPAPQRYVVLHIKRAFHDQYNNVKQEDSGFWVTPMDYNGPQKILDQVPELTSVNQVDCSNDLYCGMPYYFPVVSKLGKTYYVPAEKPKIHTPLRMQLISQKLLNADTRRLTFNLTGPSHMGAIISPSLTSRLVNWSFADGIPPSGPRWKSRATYFVYYSHGEVSPPWSFSIDLKIPINHTKKEPFLTVAMTTHNLHGPDQISPELEKFLTKFPNWTYTASWTATFQLWDYHL